MKFNLNKKRSLIVMISLSCAFSMVGCSKTYYESKKESSPVTDISINSQETTEDVQTTSLESTVSPSSFSDFIDETVPDTKIRQSDFNAEDFAYDYYYFGTYTLGRGNPNLEQALKKYLSNDSVSVNDIPYFENPCESYNPDFHDNMYYDIDFIRYVCEENNLRLFVDEIDYELFKEKFPEFVEVCDNGRIDDLAIVYLNDFPEKLDYKGSLIDVNYMDADLHELSELTCFYQLRNYNSEREHISANLPDEYGGLIKNGLSVDGEYVWCLTEKQYDCFSEDLHKIPKCENINILVPETREDLIASGIDVEKYDKMCEELFGGAKMEKNKTKSRG